MKQLNKGFFKLYFLIFIKNMIVSLFIKFVCLYECGIDMFVLFLFFCEFSSILSIMGLLLCNVFFSILEKLIFILQVRFNILDELYSLVLLLSKIDIDFVLFFFIVIVNGIFF